MAGKVAAGLIIFRRQLQPKPVIEYLMLQTSYGIHHWTPPKGHVDPGETEITAAIRETEEEAGLTEGRDYELFSKTFTLEANYPVNGVPKRTVYWLAEMKRQETNEERVKLSHEHQAFRWVGLDEAFAIAGFDSMKDILRQANEYIIKN